MGTIVNFLSFAALLLAAESICFATNGLLKLCVYKSRARKRSGGTARRFAIGIVRFLDKLRLPWVILATVILLFLLGVARAAFSVNAGQYTYIQTETAEQKSVDVLFDEEPVKPNPAGEEADQRNTLNIPEEFLGADISLDMVNYFEARLDPIYKQGHETQYVKMTLPENSIYDVWDNKYIEEAVDYKKKYKNNSNLGVHYQYGRALTDAGMTFDSAPFSLKLAMMADSVSALEALTIYEEWNANNEDEPVMINVCLLAFMNGKLFLHNAPLAAGNEEGRDYVNCFYVEAYVCFCKGKEQSNDENTLYALICYYIGNAGENLLAKIDKNAEPTLYRQVYNTTLDNYKEAKKLFTDKPDFYHDELGILTRIKNGITTLQGLEAPAA